MRRLTEEEVARVDSSKETLTKWYNFLRKAAENVGFGPTVYNNLKPFEKDGFEVPVTGDLINLEESGRIFYKLSTADRLMSRHMLVMSRADSTKPALEVQLETIMQTVVSMIRNGKELPDIEGIDMAKLKEDVLDSTAMELQYIKNSVFIDACLKIMETLDLRIMTKNPYLWSGSIDDNIQLINASEFAKEWVATIRTEMAKKHPDNRKIAEILADIRRIYSESPLLRAGFASNYFKILTQEFDTISSSYVIIPRIKYFENMFETIEPQRQFGSIVINISEYLEQSNFINVYNEKYFVLSMNPIDKLMASTKQPYGSCLSLCSEGSNTGSTGSTLSNGTGLFALMPSDEVYMIYYCNGKHKNMYWETEEWEKNPDYRNKDKAYKFFKFTLRQFGYKAHIFNMTNENVQEELEYITDTYYNGVKEIIRDRILPGRTYTVSGEQRMFEFINAVLLDSVGIRSSYTTLRDVCEIANATGKAHHLVRGYLLKNEVCFTDRYGFKRGIYFDNVSLQNKIANSPILDCNLSKEQMSKDTKVYETSLIRTGNERTGSCGVTERYIDNNYNVNSFDLMNGKVQYSKFNTYIEVCDECGDFEYSVNKYYGIKENKVLLELQNGRHVCLKCATELGYKKCETCNIYYTEDKAHLHEQIDLADYLPNPERIKENNRWLCKAQLGYIEWREDNFKVAEYGVGSKHKYICPFCGEIHGDSLYARDLLHAMKQYTQLDIDGVTVKARACNDCIQNSIICDVCKKMVFIDPKSTEPIVLLPNKRTVCMHCLDRIRIEKRKKEELKEALTILKVSGKDYIPEDDLEDDTRFLPEDSIYMADVSPYAYNERKRIKDKYKQIDSRTSRTGKGYPEIAFNV